MKRFQRLFAFPLAGMLAGGTVLAWKHFSSFRWSQSQAKIVASDVVWVGTGGNRGYFMPAIEFEYTVDGRAYVSSRVELGMNYRALLGGSRNDAENLVVAYPVHTAVKVFYDREYPGDATLKPGLPLKYVGISLSVICLICIGVESVYLSVQRRYARRTTNSNSKQI